MIDGNKSKLEMIISIKKNTPLHNFFFIIVLFFSIFFCINLYHRYRLITDFIFVEESFHAHLYLYCYKRSWIFKIHRYHLEISCKYRKKKCPSIQWLRTCLIPVKQDMILDPFRINRFSETEMLCFQMLRAIYRK